MPLPTYCSLFRANEVLDPLFSPHQRVEEELLGVVTVPRHEKSIREVPQKLRSLFQESPSPKVKIVILTLIIKSLIQDQYTNIRS
jgi:hypothetical protein